MFQRTGLEAFQESEAAQLNCVGGCKRELLTPKEMAVLHSNE
jgi:hypothetical protein